MFLSAWMEGLTPQMVKKAQLELGETPEVRKKAVQELHKILKDEPNLRPRFEEKFLLRYLRAKKYNVSKAYKSIMCYYYFKSKYDGIFTNFKPSEVKHVLDMNCISLLPLRNPDGTSIGVLRMGNFDTSKASCEELIATSLICAEIGTDNEATIVCGSVCILDMQGFTLRKMLQFSSINLLSLFVASLQECVACRVKSLHVVNEPYYCTQAFKIVKKFMNKKLKERLHFHGSNLESLHNHIPVEILPKYLGGHLSDSNKEYNSKILDKDSYFEDINKYGYPPKFKKLRRPSKLLLVE